MSEFKKKKVLLHICCAGCGAFVSRVLMEEGYEVFLYYYNPNVSPVSEYKLRAQEVEKIAKEFNLKFFVEVYDHLSWLVKIRGLKKEPEKGKRCLVCYLDRLAKVAKKAKKENFDYFASTLSVSPHKDSTQINHIGKELENSVGVEFFFRDFKKKDGFKKASNLAKELDLYRQDYCGCEFSKRLTT